MTSDITRSRHAEFRRLDAALLAAGVALLAIVIGASAALAAAPGEMLTRNTIRLALAWYFAALGLMLCLDQSGWRAATVRGRLARWCWTWAAGCFLIHVALAFHYYHHWSHQDAFERTRQVSGLGEGIYFSYLFALVWTADALCWWLVPGRFAARSPWIDRVLHAFMLFMVFNGMIVYETGPIRWAGIAMFTALPLLWLRTRPPRESRRLPLPLAGGQPAMSLSNRGDGTRTSE